MFSCLSYYQLCFCCTAAAATKAAIPGTPQVYTVWRAGDGGAQAGAVAAVSAPVRSTPVWKERSLPQVSFTGRSGVSSVPHGVLSSTSWAQSLYSVQVSPICATDGDGVSVRVGDALLSIGSWACTQERGQGG